MFGSEDGIVLLGIVAAGWKEIVWFVIGGCCVIVVVLRDILAIVGFVVDGTVT